MKPSLLFSFTLCLLLAGVSAPRRDEGQRISSHSQPEFPCPVITVACSDSVMLESPAKFSAKISGAGPSPSLTLSWTVDAGVIISGQNQTHVSVANSTTDIAVDTTGLQGYSTVTATVEVGGLDRSCANKTSCTSALIHPPPLEHFDEYGNINLEYEQARLDTYAVSLQNDPTMNGYIVCYGGHRARRGEAMARGERAKKYLVNRRGFDSGRIITVDGGFRENLTVVLWILPPNMKPPIDPTVNPSEVQFINGPQKPRGRSVRKRRPGE